MPGPPQKALGGAPRCGAGAQGGRLCCCYVTMGAAPGRWGSSPAPPSLLASLAARPGRCKGKPRLRGVAEAAEPWQQSSPRAFPRKQRVARSRGPPLFLGGDAGSARCRRSREAPANLGGVLGAGCPPP